MNRFRSLFACCLLFLSPALAHAAPPQATAKAPETSVRESAKTPGTLDISFPGGTLQDYYDALRTQGPGANIVVDPGADRLAMARVDVKGVSLEEAVRVPARLIPGVNATGGDGDAKGGQASRAVFVITIDPIVFQRAEAAQSPGTFDVRFPGGTVAEYADVIRKARPVANIVLDPDIERVQLPPILLSGVTTEAAVKVVQGYILSKPFGQIVVRAVGIAGSPEQAFRFEISRPQVEQPSRFAVWSLASIIQAGMKSDDVLAAVNAGLKLVEKDARVQFHAETGLLMTFGTEEQIRAIDKVVGGLRESTAGRQPEANAGAAPTPKNPNSDSQPSKPSNQR